ncbi:hypothetical protein BD410DRAFT_490181 [Rickenella mellea]|uniref:Uncharacterized protein n=1 Tax=Rickenella mellea TaxID=50990 RepID=A0A4Y7PU86_9AGAM|nr:hypothetical protein BD410DRAFT_490181 [Rickenella mellea]
MTLTRHVRKGATPCLRRLLNWTASHQLESIPRTVAPYGFMVIAGRSDFQSIWSAPERVFLHQLILCTYHYMFCSFREYFNGPKNSWVERDWRPPPAIVCGDFYFDMTKIYSEDPWINASDWEDLPDCIALASEEAKCSKLPIHLESEEVWRVRHKNSINIPLKVVAIQVIH